MSPANVAVPVEALATLRRRLAALPNRHSERKALLLSAADLYAVSRATLYVNALLDDIETELPACRQGWWRIRRTTCLANQWAREMPHRLELLPASAPDARQIADAIYDPDQEQLRVTFQDGATLDVRVSR